MKTVELLDAAKAASGCETDYQFAKRYGMTLAAVSRWRQGKATFSDDHAALVASILGKEAGEVMALCAAERAKSEAGRRRWLRVAALLAAIVAPPAAGGSGGGQVDNNARPECQLSEIRRGLRRFLSGPQLMAL